MKMKMESSNALWQTVKRETIKKSPQILMGIGIAGSISALILGIKETPKALELLQEIKNKREDEEIDKKEEAKEIITKVVPVYLPAILTEVAAITCMITSVNVSTRRAAAVATAYSLLDNSYNEFKDKVKEVIDEKQMKEIEERIAQDKTEQHPVLANEVDVAKGGHVLFYDPIADKHFESSVETVKGIINKLNYRLRQEMFISYNDFRYELGLRPTSNGDDIGWNIDRGEISPSWTPSVVTEEGLYQNQLCYVLEFSVGPRYDFRDLM